MSLGTTLSFFYPTLGAILVAAGALLLKRGRWPRRVGQTPHCLRCNYILAGEPPRCPECGTPVHVRSVVHGERHRRAGLTLLGTFSGLVGTACVAVFVTRVASSMSWIQHEPLFSLRHELRSSNAAVANSAWDEIQRRMDAHLLSEADHFAVVDSALDAQCVASHSRVGKSMLTYIAGRYLDARLPKDEADRLFERMLAFELRVRPVVGSTNRVPYLVTGAGFGPDNWLVDVRLIEAQIDAGPVQPLLRTTGGNLNDAWIFRDYLPPVPAAGTHHLRLRVELSIHAAGSSWIVLRRLTQDLRADFRVVDGPTPIETVTQPSASVMQALLTPGFAPRDLRRFRLRVYMTAGNLPVDVAFHVFLRFGGVEFAAGDVCCKRTGDTEWLKPDFVALIRAPRADVILRSDEGIARDTLDITRIWKGEIIYRDVVIPDPSTTAYPTHQRYN